MATTTPGALAPGFCLLSRGAVPRGSGAAVRSVDRFQIGGFQLWSELPALAPGARCRLGRSVGSGAPRAMQWTATGLTRQERQMIRRECWSRGRIVSALLLAAQGGCLPSMEPPNPVAATMLPPARAGNGRSGFDTALHGRQWPFMKGLHGDGFTSSSNRFPSGSSSQASVPNGSCRGGSPTLAPSARAALIQAWSTAGAPVASALRCRHSARRPRWRG